MPIPKPRTNEPKEDFLERCMADSVMNNEYPDKDQRYAVCNEQWRKKAKVYKDVDAKVTEGSFHGYAATWDIDQQGERFVRGCFAKSIQERVAAIPVMVKHAGHGGDVLEQVGMLTGAHEDEIGLAVSGRFHTDALSESVRQKVIDGAPKFMSVGFQRIQGRKVSDIYEHTEVKLCEITLTNFPANPQAKILDAKSMRPQPLTESRKHLQWMEQERLRLRLLEVSYNAR